MSEITLPQWPYAYGGPSGSGVIKQSADDFIVEEQLSFVPDGSGEHVFLQIEKCHENTEYVARLLARHAGVRQRDVSFAGLKDRHGRTRQWFSVWLPGKDGPDWQALNSDNLQVLSINRHARKLKRGVLAANQFHLRIRSWQGDTALLEQQLQLISRQGYPNYFGEQRFGHQGRNVAKALAMFGGARVKREQRSIYLSAARSYLFNLIVAERVRMQTWNQGLPGDVLQLANSHSYFASDSIDAALQARLDSADIHPTALLWGKGSNTCSGQALALEQAVIASQPELAEGLLAAGVDLDRRAMRVMVDDLRWQFEEPQTLCLSFRLPAGSYATGLLRELVTISE